MMKRVRFSLLGFVLFLMSLTSEAQYVAITDANFRAFFEAYYPTCMSGGMLDTTCTEVVTETHVDMQYWNIANLSGIEYFDALTYLDCHGNQLAFLPPLPILLDTLFCGYNQLTSLPTLPNSLLYLHSDHNKLTVLPTLPASLANLSCGYNQLSSLPSLPSLSFLVCDSNQLTILPPLPNSLLILRCGVNQLTILPPLPSGLQGIDCHDNQLLCLPVLPNTLNYLDAVVNYITCLPNIPSSPPFYFSIYTVCNPFNNNGCDVFPLIAGTVFMDTNANELYDLTENGYANVKVEIQPGNYILTTDSNGYYATNVDIGNYTIQVKSLSSPYYTILPAVQNVSFNALGQTSTTNDFAMQANAVINDLAVVLTPNGKARPGRGVVYTIAYANKGTTTLSGDVQLEYDAALTVDSTSLAVNLQSSTLLTWNFVNLKPGQSKTIHVYCTASTSIANGDILQLKATMNPMVGDEVVLDNVDSLDHIVTTSYDPNFKEVTPAANITPAQVASQENFTYTVHFQNTGSDTAFVVIVKDTISTNFEIQEIQTLSSSHPCTLNMKNGAAAWMFYNVLLPDSTTNEPASHGFVKYRIIPKNSLLLGDEIKNTAHIFFDYNAPVETNTTVNRVAISLGVQDASSSNNLLLYPNPTKGLLTLSIASKGIGTIRISNVKGTLIQQLEGIDLSNELSLDLSAEAKGVYIIQVIASEGVMTKKVVVN